MRHEQDRLPCVEVPAKDLQGQGVVFCPNPTDGVVEQPPARLHRRGHHRRGQVPLLRHGLPTQGRRDAARRALSAGARAMTPEARGDIAADWHALAHEALLDHVNRGDARHALQTLLSALARRLDAPCELLAQQADGSTRWQISATPGLGARGEATRGPAPAAALQLPLSRLGRQVGMLRLHVPDMANVADRLEPVCVAMAALLLNDATAGEPPPRAGYVQMIRSALQGGGTFVWEWDIDTDGLSDIDEGLQQLGYGAHEIGRTQEDWNQLIHPDDLAANHEAYLRHARGELDHYEHAYRIRARDGQWRWYQERGRIVEWHADGRPMRMVGTQTDISAQREQEQAASAAAARLERTCPARAGHPVPVRAGCRLRASLPLSERPRAHAVRAGPGAGGGERRRADGPHRRSRPRGSDREHHRVGPPAVAVAMGVPRACLARQRALGARHLVADARQQRHHRVARLHAGRDRAARTGAGAPGQGCRRGGQPREDRVPVAHEPRAAHAAERGAGLLAAAGDRPRRQPERGPAAACQADPRGRRASAAHDRRPARPDTHRKRQPAGADRRRADARTGRRGHRHAAPPGRIRASARDTADRGASAWLRAPTARACARCC